MANETCFKCGVVFAIPDILQAELRMTHGTFYCPNGHGQYFPAKSDLEKANEEIARLKSNWKIRDRLLDAAKKDNLTLGRQIAALRAVITRFKNQRKKSHGR
jgi:uncharacterized Zn finger protein (UPF0148 family)